MWVSRLVASLVLFGALAVAATLPVGMEADRAITIWLHRSIQSADVGPAATRLVFLANAATVIPLVAATGIVLWLLGDSRRGGALVLLAVVLLGVSLLASAFAHVIVHPGPPNELRLQFPRPADNPMESLVSTAHAAVIVAVVVAATLLFVFLRDAGRRPVSVWPAVAVFGMAMAALLLRHLASGVPRSLAGMLTGLAGYGYPSGHVARTTVLAGTALRRLPVLGAGIVGAMMLALVYLGDHWASEVLGGLCLGWACAEVCTRAWQRAGETSRRRGR